MICDQDQYAIGMGLIRDEVIVNKQLTVVRKRDHAAVGTFTLSDDVVHVWQFERNEPPTEHDYAGDSAAAFRP